MPFRPSFAIKRSLFKENNVLLFWLSTSDPRKVEKQRLIKALKYKDETLVPLFTEKFYHALFISARPLFKLMLGFIELAEFVLQIDRTVRCLGWIPLTSEA